MLSRGCRTAGLSHGHGAATGVATLTVSCPPPHRWPCTHIPSCANARTATSTRTRRRRALPPQREYVAALLADLDMDPGAVRADPRGREIVSVFFGGGTPTCSRRTPSPPSSTARRSARPFARDAEITTETNPGIGGTRPLRRLPTRRREPPQLRRAELRRRGLAAPQAHPRRGRSRGGGEVGAGRRAGQPQP